MNADSTQALRDQLQRARGEAERRHLAALRERVRTAMAKAPPVVGDVYVFGSWATGAFDGLSDTDLLAVVDDPARVAEAEQRLMTVADDVVAVSAAQWQRCLVAEHPFYRRLEAERQLLVGRDGVLSDG